MKRLIYRIEDENGIGFYQSNKLDIEYSQDVLHLCKDKHEAPIRDIGIERHVEENEKCGFLNEKQMYNWIDKNKIGQLEKHGLKLVRLYVEVTAIGIKQILFIDHRKPKDGIGVYHQRGAVEKN